MQASVAANIAGSKSAGMRRAVLGGRVVFTLVAGVVLVAIAYGAAWNLAIWPVNQSSAKALARRAQYFWDLRLSGDMLGAYQYQAEAYRRRVEPGGFARSGGVVAYTGAKVKGVTLDEKGGLVELELTYRVTRPSFTGTESTAVVTERWVVEDGAWHRWPPELGG